MRKNKVIRLADYVIRMKDAYSAAVSYKSTHRQLLDRLSETVWNHEHYKRLTAYERGYLHGCDEMLSKSIYQHLYFAYDINGCVQTWDEWRKANPGNIDLTIWGKDGTAVGHHYWNGTTKVY